MNCLDCRFYVWLKLFGDETFSYCPAHNETVKDIDLRIGYWCSPAITERLLQGVPCEKWEGGISVSETTKENPFVLHTIRSTGETYLLHNQFTI